MRHIIICEYTWGGVPTDTKWTISTNIYKEMELKLIERQIIKPLN